MSDDPSKKPGESGKNSERGATGGQDARRKRLAEALRANLKRRKAAKPAPAGRDVAPEED